MTPLIGKYLFVYNVHSSPVVSSGILSDGRDCIFTEREREREVEKERER